MKTKLITALRLTASALEQGTFNYEWTRQCRCNCGSLVCALTGMSANQLAEKIKWGARPDHPSPGYGYTWSEMSGLVCPIAGKPTDEIFGVLCERGLTTKDIVELEYLTNPEVVKRIKLPPVIKIKQTGWLWWRRNITVNRNRNLNYKNPEHVALYMRAWADLLTEEGKDDVVTTQPETESVSTN